MVQHNIEKVHMALLGRLCRRGVAFVLAAAISLSLLPATARADSVITPPTQVTDKNEFPKIEFQTNFVRTEYGTLTGLMELAIRVGPSGTVTGANDKETSVPVDFQSVAATLQFNRQLFQPISWKWAYGEMGEAPSPDLKLSADNYYDVQLPAKKDDTLPGTGAVAQCGIVDAATAEKLGMSTNVVGGDQALLFFKAEAYGTKLTITEMTTLAVIRFYVNPDLMEHISILRNKVTGDYSVLFDGDKNQPITDRALLDTAIKTVATITTPTTPNPDPDPDPDTPTTRANTLTLPADFISVGFAADSDMVLSESPAYMSLDYSTGDNEFYFVPGCDPTLDENDPTNLNSTLEQVSGMNLPAALPAPKTGGERVLAVDPAVADETDPKRYSYLTNLIPAKNITFPVVSQLSFADHGDGRENMATVVFYDWDDTLIGVLVVPRNDDARDLVNTYVRDNMIHPNLRFDVQATNPNYDLITSLARVDTYRGKYPATEPKLDGATDSTVDKDGTRFPLTAKLDYVFLKRPMSQTAKGTTAAGQPTSTWTQPLDENEEVFWDDEYPYIHGWALIPDDDLTDIQYTHPENLWTTIGMGELTDYTGAVSGGYQDMNNAAAELIAIGQEFEIANFDFHENPQKKGTVYAVKALYEPGENLLSSFYQYRLIKSPYYNKLNGNAANAGGAYSVETTYERATTSIGSVVRGVARIREIVVQMDSTTDMKWEDPELNSATKSEADNTKTKTSYVPVAVDNGDEVVFSLTLSARFNRIDYYLIDRYNNNFVGGQKRTGGNAALNSQHGEDDYINYMLENYNYFTDDSERSDIYYDVINYDEREGSLGFVLYGTLNNVMEHATDRALNPADTAFNTYVTYATLRDGNIRTKDGAIAATSNQSGLRTSIIEAANIASTRRNAPDFWNAEKGYAELTYHQLQLYIIDPGRGLLSREAADNIPIVWCNLHEKCVNERTGKPTDWKTLIAAARGEEPYKLEAFTNLEDAESLAHLRKTADGGAFADRDEFSAALRVAVATFSAGQVPSWDQVQATILGQTLPAQQERSYWWYDGSTSLPLNSLSDSVATVQDIITPVTMPDGTVMSRYDKLNGLKTAFENNAASATVDRNWNNATKNLCITIDGSDGEKFATFADFRTAFIAAVTAAQNAGVILDPLASAAELKDYWQKLQYHILNKTFSATHLTEMDGYWWYDGNSKIGDLASLLAAAKRALPISQGGENDSVILDLFTLDDLYAITSLHFSQNFKGEHYTDVDAFKGAVKQFVRLSGVTIATGTSTDAQKTNSWNQLQYYLIHNDDTGFDPTTIVRDSNAERVYYWWRNGATGATYPLTTNATDTGIATLMEAIYRTEANGNPLAYDQLIAAAMEGFRLVSSYTAEETWADLPKYGTTGDSMDTLKTKLTGLYAAIAAAGDDYTAVSWRQIQHYLLGKGYVSNSALAADDSLIPSDDRGDKDGYWWREGNEKPGDGPKKTDLEYFIEEIDRFLNGDISEDALTGVESGADSALDRYVFSGNLGLYGKDMDTEEPVPITSDSVDRDMIRWYINDLANTMLENGEVTAVGIVDWYVLQYIILNEYYWGDPIITPEDAFDYYQNTLNGDWVPDEYKAESTSLLMVAVMEPEVEVEIDPETGLITTTTPDTITELPGGLVQVQRTVTVLSLEGQILEITTVIEIYDTDYNLISEQTVTMPTPEPEEPAQPEESTCTCGSEDETHTEDCPLYEAPDEPVEPAETLEPIESGEPTETEEPTETGEPAETDEPTETEEPSESPEPPESPEPAESSEPKGTLESVPEFVDPDTLEPEKPEPSEPPEAQESEEAEAGDEAPVIMVAETPPPLGAVPISRNTLGSSVYRKMTTKVVTSNRRFETGQTKLLARAGGVKMKQLNIRRIISPPGQRGIPLLSGTDITERRRAL